MSNDDLFVVLERPDIIEKNYYIMPMLGVNCLKVLHVLPSFTVGGAEKMVLDILKNMNTDGIVSDLCVINDYYDDSMIEMAKSLGVNAFYINRQLKSKRIKDLENFNKVLKKGYDIVHTHDTLPCGLAGILKILGLKYRHVTTVHDTKIIKNASKPYLMLHRSCVDKTICISESVKNECISAGIKNSQTIYNGIDVYKFKNAAKTLYSINREIKAVTVSRIDVFKKGLDVLVKAVKRCINKGMPISLDIIGTGREEELKRLKDIIKDYKLSEKIRLLGARDNIHELLCDYNLFLLGSRYEGFGLAVVEAMAAGLPVIASDIDGPKEIINHEENGFLFETENDMELAEIIGSIYNKYDTLKSLSNNAVKRAGDFEIKRMCNEYLLVYNSLLK